ncbi:MAG: hypothetical protein MUC45_12540 [Actinomycetia bacterium]|nr:hypothetical protein [Actinomycetes bacterium]
MVTSPAWVRRALPLVLGVLALCWVVLSAGPAGAGRAAAASTSPSPSAAASAQTVELVLFSGEGCPHCAEARKFYAELGEQYPQLVVTEYEVWYSAENRARFEQTAEAMGFTAQSVPTTIIGDRYWVGFDTARGQEIEAVILSELSGGPEPPRTSGTIDVPLIGEVDVGSQGLLLSTAIIGFVDGVNPCSLWVLSMLLALVLHSGSRTRVFFVGSVFLFVTASLYGVYMLGLFSVLSYAGYVSWITAGVAVLAGVLGLLQVKDYVWFHEGPTLGIADERKPGLFKRMRGLAASDRSMPAVLLATAGLAVGVSLLETPCTLGLPLLWTNLLAERGVGGAEAAVLFAVYMLVFLVDELIVFALAVTTMRAAKLQERHGRELKLVSGVVMLALAATLLLAPDVMESALGALAVFGLAGLIIAVVLIVGRIRNPVPGAARH